MVLQRQMCVETGKSDPGNGYAGENLCGDHGDSTGAHHHAGDNPGAGAFCAGHGTPQRYVTDPCKQCPLGNEGEHGMKTVIGEYRRARQGATTDGTLEARGPEKRGETSWTGVKQEGSTAPVSNTLQDPSRYNMLPYSKNCNSVLSNRWLIKIMQQQVRHPVVSRAQQNWRFHYIYVSDFCIRLRPRHTTDEFTEAPPARAFR